MYSRDGDFGQVRLAEPLHTQQALDTLFCFSGAGWHRCNDRYAIRRPQGNTDPLLLFTAKGEGQLRIDTGSWRLKPGSVAFIPADAPHEYGTPAGGIWEFTWIHLCGRLALQFVQQLGTGILPVHHAAVYGEMVEQLLTLYRQPVRTAEIQASRCSRSCCTSWCSRQRKRCRAIPAGRRFSIWTALYPPDNAG